MIEANINRINKIDAQHVLYFFGEGGLEAGGFTKPLLEAIAHADSENFFRLSLSFPSLCLAWYLGARTEDGINVLKSIIERKEE